MREKHQIFDVLDLLQDPSIVKVASIAPSVRVTISEEMGLQPGAFTTEQIIHALRVLGFDYVFDTCFSADLTIMEEGSELLQRIANDGPFPMFTSCCPGVSICNLISFSFIEQNAKYS
jgi:NADH-quinone oxidoreductase subunit G